MENIFIAESVVGEHHKVSDKFKADLLSFTFIPLVNSTYYKEEKLTNFSKLLPNKLTPVKFNAVTIDIQNIALFIQAKKYNKIFIGMDLDVMGNAMSRIIRDYLVSSGVDSKNIIRIPLTSKGFLFVSTFWDDETMNWFTDNAKEEMEYVHYSKKTLGSFGAGRRTPLILNEILNSPSEVKNINKDGTSSITYILKKKLKEK